MIICIAGNTPDIEEKHDDSDMNIAKYRRKVRR